MGTSQTEVQRPHPAVWMLLYIPFGAFSGFVQVALTFLATKNGLSISQGALLNGAQLLSQWLKWIWAPIVDTTLSPKRWYVISTTISALAIVLLATIPMTQGTLHLLLAIIAFASLVNSIVGMAIEVLLASTIPRSELGSASGWFQAGNLGGAGLGGGLGLYLLEHLPHPWMAGLVLGGLFVACALALQWVPNIEITHDESKKPSLKSVIGDLKSLGATRAGRLAALLCFLPVGTGAAQGVLSQAAVAAHWHAGAVEVANVQGLAAGAVTAAGCFAGGWILQRYEARASYAVFGVLQAVIATVMALVSPTVRAYVIGSFVYSFAVGLSYAGFTAVVLSVMDRNSAATKYNMYASLSNFPLWWLGLLLGLVAEKKGPSAMLYCEAGLGVLGVLVFVLAAVRGRGDSETTPA